MSNGWLMPHIWRGPIAYKLGHTFLLYVDPRQAAVDLRDAGLAKLQRICAAVECELRVGSWPPRAAPSLPSDVLDEGAARRDIGFIEARQKRISPAWAEVFAPDGGLAENCDEARNLILGSLKVSFSKLTSAVSTPSLQQRLQLDAHDRQINQPAAVRQRDRGAGERGSGGRGGHMGRGLGRGGRGPERGGLGRSATLGREEPGDEASLPPRPQPAQRPAIALRLG
jgi:hypothetical protein